MNKDKKYPIEKTDKDWETVLSPEEYKILREKGPSIPSQGNTMIIMRRELIYARVVQLRSTKAKVSLTVIVGGQVMIVPLRDH